MATDIKNSGYGAEGDRADTVNGAEAGRIVILPLLTFSVPESPVVVVKCTVSGGSHFVIVGTPLPSGRWCMPAAGPSVRMNTPLDGDAEGAPAITVFMGYTR